MSAELDRVQAAVAVTIVNPASGEIIRLADARVTELDRELDRAEELIGRLRAHRDRIITELAARADRRGARKVTLDGVTYEVNAPTEELYDVGRLRAELGPLVEDGVIDGALVNEVIVDPPRPPAPPPRVDRRKINALKRSSDKRLLAALAAARTVTHTRRTVKIIATPVDGDAEELA